MSFSKNWKTKVVRQICLTWKMKYWSGGKLRFINLFRAEYGHPSSVSRLRTAIVEHRAEKVRLINTWADLESDSKV